MGMPDGKKWLCVVDLEATCWENKRMPGPNGQGWVEPQMEIIEIGAQLLRLPQLELEDEFDTFIRPKLNPVLSDFCKTLTSIRQEDVDKAPLFPDALEKFVAWLKPAGPIGSVLFGSWGFYDKNQLKLDCELHGVAYPFDDSHINIKQYVAQKMGWNGKGVGKALGLLGMEFEGTPHRGIDDVRNIVRIARKVGL